MEFFATFSKRAKYIVGFLLGKVLKNQQKDGSLGTDWRGAKKKGVKHNGYSESIGTLMLCKQ